MEKLKALVIDDSALYRKILSDILMEMPEVELLGTAPNGRMALDKIEKTSPDFVTLDFEMPEMDGLEVLRQLKAKNSPVKAIMVSAHTKAGASVTMQALEGGAFDFVTKPDGSSMAGSKTELVSQLKPLVATLLMKKKLRPAFGHFGTPAQTAHAAPAPAAAKPLAPTAQGFAGSIAQRMKAVASARPEIVAIGVSTGGPNALTQVIPKLPARFRVPVVLVQHMPPVFTGALAESLGRKSAIAVFEASEGMEIKPGGVYIAPGGKHMKLDRTTAGTLVARITDDPPENNCRPAVDYLFRSVAKLFGPSAVGVIMTGMGADGVKGMGEMRALGAKTFAQDEASCVVYGMPMEAVRAGVVDVVLPLDRIAEEIVAAVR